ncbi:reverse transcriptase domain-containing protein [Tanacetum coccineum]|uniref:Reverse transcriptase domain-containing protein n=1 Tax=Tanacetum coccineum TaxID=301880 RepID=A0ABQ4XAZ2_9ASTR
MKKKTCKKTIKIFKKNSAQYSSTYETTILNIFEEDIEPQPNSPIQEIIILDPDDQPMWESAKIVAPTPNSVIVRPDVDDNFVINSTHLKMISENKFDGQLRVNPHDHIREFIAIYDMFKYGETQSEDVKLLIFTLFLCDKAKTSFNELNEESITSWDQMKRVFINRFFPSLLFNHLLREIRSFSQNVCESLTDACIDEPTQGILDETAGGIFLYKIPDQAFQFLDDKSLKEEMHEMRKNYNNCGGDNDDTPVCERHEANSIQFQELNNDLKNDLEDFKSCISSMRTVHDKLLDKDDQSKTDLEKSMTKFLDGQRISNMFVKNNINDIIIKMKQNEKNCQTIFKNMERKIDEWSKSQNAYSKQTDRTDPPPPQAHTEHVNVVFTGSEKSIDSSKIQKDPPPLSSLTIKSKKINILRHRKRKITW